VLSVWCYGGSPALGSALVKLERPRKEEPITCFNGAAII